MRIGSASALVALLLMAGLSPARAGPAEWIIRPGESVGPFRLGMDRATVESILTRDESRADEQIIEAGQPRWIYYREGLQVHWDRNRVFQLVVDKPRAVVRGEPVVYRTEKGITIGDTLERIQAAYGRGYVHERLPTAKDRPQQHAYYYKDLGIGFQLEAGRVIYIYVLKPIP